jgi:hypothetical protein
MFLQIYYHIRFQGPLNKLSVLICYSSLKITHDRHFNIINSRNFTTLLQLPPTQFVAQIYHTFTFTTCFGLMGPSSCTLGVYNSLFLFLLLCPHWPVFTHWECAVCMVSICSVLRNVLLIGYVTIKILRLWMLKLGLKLKYLKYQINKICVC